MMHLTDRLKKTLLEPGTLASPSIIRLYKMISHETAIKQPHIQTIIPPIYAAG
jgi:hypothetical protein